MSSRDESKDHRRTKKKKKPKGKGVSINGSFAANSGQELAMKIAAKYSFPETRDACATILWSSARHTERCAGIIAANKIVRSMFTGRAMSRQFVNHWPGMNTVADKLGLSDALNRMNHLLPDDFGFFPRSWNLRDKRERASFCQHMMHNEKTRRSTCILKPPAGAEGNGILLVQKWSQAQRLLESAFTDFDAIAQVYIDNPLLVDGFKWDMRLYVVVLDIFPLKFAVIREGLARFCTQPYQAPNSSNLHQSYQHLTNYSLNKGSATFKKNEDTEFGSESKETQGEQSSKRFIRTVFRQLDLPSEDSQGESKKPTTEQLWERIEHMVGKTLIACWPDLFDRYIAFAPPPEAKDDAVRPYFHVLGLDVLLDADYRPWLLELNQNPSMLTDSNMDMYLKQSVMECVFQMIGVLGQAEKEPSIQLNAGTDEKREVATGCSGRADSTQLSDQQARLEYFFNPGDRTDISQLSKSAKRRLVTSCRCHYCKREGHPHLCPAQCSSYTDEDGRYYRVNKMGDYVYQAPLLRPRLLLPYRVRMVGDGRQDGISVAERGAVFGRDGAWSTLSEVYLTITMSRRRALNPLYKQDEVKSLDERARTSLLRTLQARGSMSMDTALRHGVSGCECKFAEGEVCQHYNRGGAGYVLVPDDAAMAATSQQVLKMFETIGLCEGFSGSKTGQLSRYDMQALFKALVRDTGVKSSKDRNSRMQRLSFPMFVTLCVQVAAKVYPDDDPATAMDKLCAVLEEFQ